MISTLQHHQDLPLLLCNTLGADEALTPGLCDTRSVKLMLGCPYCQPSVTGKDAQEPDEGGMADRHLVGDPWTEHL